jgi:hypothetical protein
MINVFSNKDQSNTFGYHVKNTLKNGDFTVSKSSNVGQHIPLNLYTFKPLNPKDTS